MVFHFVSNNLIIVITMTRSKNNNYFYLQIVF